MQSCRCLRFRTPAVFHTRVAAQKKSWRLMWKAFGVMCLTGARALVLHHTDATSSECLPTTSMRLRADTVGQIGNGGVIDSFHGRERKRVGGDDLYVSIVEDGFDVAVAHVNDLADGSYELFFERVEMPAPRAPPRASHRKDTAQPAQLRVVLQFSCGIGRLSPPLKQWWNDSGWIRQTLPLRRAQGAPSSQALVPAASLAPASPSLIDLHRFAAIAAIGDSTLRMFRPLDSTQVPQLHFTDCSGAMNWRPGMCQDAANAALKAQGGRSHGSRQLVIFGSGSWDILDSRGFSPRRDTSSTTLEQYKVQFTKCFARHPPRVPRRHLPNEEPLCAASASCRVRQGCLGVYWRLPWGVLLRDQVLEADTLPEHVARSPALRGAGGGGCRGGCDDAQGTTQPQRTPCSQDGPRRWTALHAAVQRLPMGLLLHATATVWPAMRFPSSRECHSTGARECHSSAGQPCGQHRSARMQASAPCLAAQQCSL